jgi:uncharacterized protein
MRVVLDTNTAISALLFAGTASRLVALWQSRRIAVLVSRAMLQEYLRVLAYPKFHLGDDDIKALIQEELLLFVETVQLRKPLTIVHRDPDDNKFVECAAAGRARYLVTGDQDLRQLENYRRLTILTVGQFLERTGL